MWVILYLYLLYSSNNRNVYKYIILSKKNMKNTTKSSLDQILELPNATNTFELQLDDLTNFKEEVENLMKARFIRTYSKDIRNGLWFPESTNPRPWVYNGIVEDSENLYLIFLIQKESPDEFKRYEHTIYLEGRPKFAFLREKFRSYDMLPAIKGLYVSSGVKVPSTNPWADRIERIFLVEE